MNVSVERPLFLLAAGVLPFIVMISRRFFKAAFTIKLSLGPQGGRSLKPPRSARVQAKMLGAAEIAAAVCMLAAAANPVEVTVTPVYRERGADIIFVLDISPSMAVLDITGADGEVINRFDAARFLILSFIDDYPASATGLAAVGEDAALLIPATIDRDLFRQRLESLRIGELGDGTALGTGLSLAAFHLWQSKAPLRVCVLITDGENNAGSIHPETAAEALAAAETSLFVIGIGSGGETMLDYVDPETNRRRRGMYGSRYDAESLARIAEKAGGVFLEARSGDELGRAFLRVSERAALPVRAEMVRNAESRAAPLIITALVLTLASFALRYGASRWFS
jgi:Ca-activated chloride channel family protein